MTQADHLSEGNSHAEPSVEALAPAAAATLTCIGGAKGPGCALGTFARNARDDDPSCDSPAKRMLLVMSANQDINSQQIKTPWADTSRQKGKTSG